MTNEEKILDILASMQGDMHDMDRRLTGRMDAFENAFQKTNAKIETCIEPKLDALENAISKTNAKIETCIEPKLDALENAILKINVKIETDIETKLDALAEGHAAILEQLTPRTRIDDMENEIRFLKNMVYHMSEELEKLKIAQ